ncbi:MAG: hypothetical protein LAO08_14285 [Acidobacteriia bacterium]|nr:hypothetical protein [Terriglobia bacterium]
MDETWAPKYHFRRMNSRYIVYNSKVAFSASDGDAGDARMRNPALSREDIFPHKTLIPGDP